MDTQKLYRVAKDVYDEFTDYDFSTQLANLAQYVAQNTSNAFDVAKEITDTLDRIYANSVTNQYAPTYLEILGHLGAINYVGNGGKTTLHKLLNGNPLTLATGIQDYYTTFTYLFPKIQKLIESLDEIGIKPYVTEDYEFGYVVPADLSDLDIITKRLKHYNKFISLSTTIAGEANSTVHLSRVSNGSLEFFVLGSITVAKVVDKVLRRIADFYKELQQIKLISANIDSINAQTLKTKTDALEAMVNMEKELSHNFVDETVEQVMTDYNGSEELRAEVATQLGVTIKLLLKDIQSGIKVEVTPPKLDDKDTETDSDKETSTVLTNIATTNKALIKLYSLPKEELRLPPSFNVSVTEEKVIENNIIKKTSAKPKTKKK